MLGKRPLLDGYAQEKYFKAVQMQNNFLVFQEAANLVSNKLECPTKEDILAFDDNCGICRDGLGWSPGTRKTLCGHMFHSECLVRWFTISRKCPMCHSAPM